MKIADLKPRPPDIKKADLTSPPLRTPFLYCLTARHTGLGDSKSEEWLKYVSI